MRTIKEKIHNWLISKLIGNKPVVANVNLKLDDFLRLNRPGVISNCRATCSESLDEKREVISNEQAQQMMN